MRSCYLEHEIEMMRRNRDVDVKTLAREAGIDYQRLFKALRPPRLTQAEVTSLLRVLGE